MMTARVEHPLLTIRKIAPPEQITLTNEGELLLDATCTPADIVYPTNKAYAVIATGKAAQYANLILKKGVIVNHAD